MEKTFSEPLSGIIKELSLEVLHMPRDPREIGIVSADVNRPGLILAGYEEFFDRDRIQILGKSEHGFLENLLPAVRLPVQEAMAAAGRRKVLSLRQFIRIRPERAKEE